MDDEKSGECCLTRLAKEAECAPNINPNPKGSWGIGMYSTKGNGEADGYGYYRPDNPNNFWPDYECCTPGEIENHKAACALYDRVSK